MERFYQFTGRHSDSSGDALVLDSEKTYVYASPRERAIDRCAVLPRGAYFACSELLFYGDQVWMKIRRGVFSSAAHSSGYLRVFFDFDEQLAAKQRRSSAFHTAPRRFKRLVELPSFPAFLCSRERLTLSRIPVFHSTSSSSSMLPHHQRQLPAASVFQATESRFSDDFAQLALKITSPFGLSGWITVSFGDVLQEVDDPRRGLATPVLVQNIAPRTGKWMGELPVRGTPSLQVPRLGNLESFRITMAVERKLVKDQVWLRLTDFDGIQGNNEDSDNERTDAWIIERHANTAERVVVPWGADDVHDESLQRDEYTERYYRNIYGRRVLPLRKAPRLESDVVGELSPGVVLVSTRRVLNERGQVWIRVPMNVASTIRDGVSLQEVTYGYAIQSSAKTNVCMLQEITPPGKMTPKQYFQLVLKPPVTKSPTNQDDGTTQEPPLRVGARAEPSKSARELFYLRDGAVVGAIGSIYNSDQKTIWLQVLREDLEPEIIEKKTLLPHEQREADNQSTEDTQYVVYIPVCYVDEGRQHECALFSLGRVMQKMPNPEHQEAERQRTGARVVFTGGRASKLFGSQLMKPSTVDLDTAPKIKTPAKQMPAARAGGDDVDPAQALKDEINAWQEQGSGGLSERLALARSSFLACVQRPFASCLQRKAATQMYAQLHQDDDDELDDGDGDENNGYRQRR